MMSSASAATRVEKATSQLLIGTDWAMNLEICDILNSDTWQTKDVVKAVKKRLQNKNPKVQFLALTLLETMMKNCGEHVRFEVIQQDVLQQMIKIVRKQNDMQVRDKVLILLDSWQEAFGGPGGKYPQYYWAYIELKRSGMPFPRRPADTPATFNPPPTNLASSSSYTQFPYGSSSYASAIQNEATQHVNGSLSLSDLNNIQNAMELLKDMLQALNPHDRAAVKDEIIADLVSQCRSNQQKIVQLVSSTGDEELLERALALNDSLQSVLAKHDAIASGSSLPVEESSRNLLMLNAPTIPTTVSVGDEEDEDDEFAQIAQRKSELDSTTENANQGASEASSPVASNALVPLDPPSPSIERKEQDLIDLLSLTLSTNPAPPPETPLTTLAPSENGSHLPASGQGYSFPQPYPVNQGYVVPPYNNYVAPWSQPAQPPSQPQLYPYGYSSGPGLPALAVIPGTFAQTANQLPASPVVSAAPTSSYMALPPPTPQPIQRFNSFGSRANNSPAAAPESQVNANLKKKETPAATKPYYMPDNLFEDLIDVKSFSLGNKGNNRLTGAVGKSSQPMINGQK